MSGTAPDPDPASWSPGASRGPGGPSPYGSRRSARAWVLGVVGAVVLALAVASVLVVWQPWQGDGGTDAVVTMSVSADEPTPPSASPAPTTEPTPAPVPGAGAEFDAATLGTLLVTPGDLVAGVPGAEGGVRRDVEPGTSAWGLLEGAAVEPASCAAAVTVTQAPPVHHDATSWSNEDLTFAQDVVVLLDSAAARAAFRALVTTIDGCARYALVVDGQERRVWTAEPAIEGQGVFPAIVHDLVLRTGDRAVQQTSGHVLVGNAIVSWTATARTAEDRAAARDVVGEPGDLAAMVERRALAAVRGLS